VQMLSQVEYRLCMFQRVRGFSVRQSTYLVVLTVVLWSWDTGCVHCVKLLFD
jgi:hypothetical protein